MYPCVIAACGRERTGEKRIARSGAANPGCRRLFSRRLSSTGIEAGRKSRLKGGCGQDCPPHEPRRCRSTTAVCPGELPGIGGRVSSLLAMQQTLFPLQFGEEFFAVHALATI